MICFALLLLVGAAATSGSIRHHDMNDKPIEMDVDAMATYRSKSLAVGGGCRPESDGYFGATSGPPSIIGYGFTMETTPLGSVKLIAEAIGDMITDAMLASAFPQICAFTITNLHDTTPSQSSHNSRHLGGKANGFQFEEIVRTEGTMEFL